MVICPLIRIFADAMLEQKEQYRQFKEWQHQPHQVAPLSEEEHECATCGTRFEGNYCPRCGQSARIGRYSFKKAFLLFLDVWGVGNRGMFRSIRDLLFRPGYMIRDYLRGMQMAYFPPFKMFFLLFTLTILVESGLNIQGINRMNQNEEEANVIAKEVSNKILTKDGQAKTQEKKAEEKADKKLSVKEDKKKDLTVSEGKRMFERMKKEAKRIGNEIDKWCDNHMSFVELILVLLFSWPLWLLIRHSPAIPDLRLSECFVAMVYISNMLTIYSLIPGFLCFSLKIDIIFSISTLILAVIAIKQMSGFSYLNTIWRMIVALVPFFFLIVFLIVVGYLLLLLYAYIKFS